MSVVDFVVLEKRRRKSIENKNSSRGARKLQELIKQQSKHGKNNNLNETIIGIVSFGMIGSNSIFMAMGMIHYGIIATFIEMQKRR